MLGACVGAVLATLGVLEPQDNLSDDVIAQINGESLRKSDYLYFLQKISEEKRRPLTAQDRRKVLDRMIEEKLLIDRGLELGLAWSDSKVSKAITSSMIETIVSNAGTVIPDDEALEEFFATNQLYFQPTPRLRVQRMQFRGDHAHQRALEAHRRLAQEKWAEVANALADPALPRLPQSLLPAAKLRDYIGAALTELSLTMPSNSYSDVQSESSGYSILWLMGLEREKGPVLEDIREQVVQEYQRRASDEALRSYLQRLRAEADLTIDQDFLQQLDHLDATTQ